MVKKIITPWPVTRLTSVGLATGSIVARITSPGPRLSLSGVGVGSGAGGLHPDTTATITQQTTLKNLIASDSLKTTAFPCLTCA